MSENKTFNASSSPNLKFDKNELLELIKKKEKQDELPSMLRVMDSYRKSVDYFNSYGIKSRPFTAGNKNGEAANGKNNKGTGTFWDLRV